MYLDFLEGNLKFFKEFQWCKISKVSPTMVESCPMILCTGMYCDLVFYVLGCTGIWKKYLKATLILFCLVISIFYKALQGPWIGSTCCSLRLPYKDQKSNWIGRNYVFPINHWYDNKSDLVEKPNWLGEGDGKFCDQWGRDLIYLLA